MLQHMGDDTVDFRISLSTPLIGYSSPISDATQHEPMFCTRGSILIQCKPANRTDSRWNEYESVGIAVLSVLDAFGQTGRYDDSRKVVIGQRWMADVSRN